MRVVGADLSITSTALALVDAGDLAGLFNHKTKGSKGDGYPEWMTRIDGVERAVIAQLCDWFYVDWFDLLVIEAPSHGSKFGNPHERAALWWAVYRWAWEHGVPVATVAPKTRQKYITGSGASGVTKKDVLAAAQATYGPRITNDDEADAVGLADMGARHLGEPLVAELPAPNLTTMEVVQWPRALTSTA